MCLASLAKNIKKGCDLFVKHHKWLFTAKNFADFVLNQCSVMYGGKISLWRKTYR